MPNDTTPSRVVTYGDMALDFDTLPETSRMAMFRRGVSHFFGSEVASKVKAHFDSEDENGIKPERTDESNAAKLAEVRGEFMARLLAGTVGVSTRGPAVDPITVIIRRLARIEVQTTLKANNLAWPKKAEDTIELPDGSKVTGAQLIDRRIARDGERLTTAAKKIALDQARAAKKAEEAAKAEGLAGL